LIRLGILPSWRRDTTTPEHTALPTRTMTARKSTPRAKAAPRSTPTTTASPPSTPTTAALIYDVYVVFKQTRIEMPIDRRFLIADDATFDELHHAIQDACAWKDAHAWAFFTKQHKAICGSFKAMPDPSSLRVETALNAKGRGRLRYLYDWGDQWNLDVVVLQRRLHDMQGCRRRLADGSRAFPPEDCGGLNGFNRIRDFLKTGEDPWGEDVAALRAWASSRAVPAD
jgi:hypothetical protein